MECWTCGSRLHVDNDCPCRVTLPGIRTDATAATTASDATTTAAPALTSPELANAQVSRKTGRACPDPGGGNGDYRRNGENGKESRRFRPPPEKDQPRLGSEQENERRAANARGRGSDQAGTAVGTGAQVSRKTGRACLDPGGGNGDYRLNGEDGKESRRFRQPPEKDQPRLGSEQENERRAANARGRGSDQAGTAVGTGAQVSRKTGRACLDPGGGNGDYRLNGEDGKESRRFRPPPEKDQPRLGSEQENERRAANARGRGSDQAGTAVGTDTGAAWPEASGTAAETLAADPAPEASLSPWVQVVNTKTEMSASGLRRAGRSWSASSLSRLPRHQPPPRRQPLLFSEGGAFSGSSSKNALDRRRSVAGPRTGAGTRRAGFPGLRAASVREGTGPNARGSPWTEQDAMARRRALGVSMRSRREQGKGPRRISGAVVAYQAAKHAVEDLCSAMPARLGALLLAFAFAVSASGRTLFLTHCGIVLGLGITLWIRASPPRPLQPRPLSYDPDASRHPRRAQPWVDVKEDDEMKGIAEPGRRSREKGGVISVENTKRLLMALVLTWFAVDAVSVLCFFRLARSIESPWLALALFQASVVYAIWVGASVASKGHKKLLEKTTFRYLVASWHSVLILTVVAARMAVPAAVRSPEWDMTAFREGVGSALVAAAAWQLARIGRCRVERSARYGMVVTLGKVLRSVDHGRQLSKESMLELAFGRWLVDYWSQPPRFSAVDMRSMLGQAASSIAKGELRGRSTPFTNVFGSDAALDWSDRSSMEAASATSGLIGALVEYLKERPGNSPLTRLDAALEPLDPSWWWSWAVLVLMACPCLCALVLLLFDHALRGLAVSWTTAGFLLSLAGPVGVEVLRFKMLRGEVMQIKAGEESSAQAPPMASKALTDDSLGFLLHRTSPELSCVLSNARLALESLRRDRSVELDVGNGQGQGGATVARAQQQQQQLQQTRMVFHDKTRTLRDVADGIGKEGGERSSSWITRESPSTPMAFNRSVENASSRGRLSNGSTRVNNSPGSLGLARPPPSPQRPLPPPSPAYSGAADFFGAAAGAVATGSARLLSNGTDVAPDRGGREGRRKSGTNGSVLAAVAPTIAPALEEAVDTIAPLEEVAPIPTSASITGDGERKAQVGDLGGTGKEASVAHPTGASDPVAAAADASAASTGTVERVRELPTPSHVPLRPAEKPSIRSAPQTSPEHDVEGSWVFGAGQAIAGTTLAVIDTAEGLAGAIDSIPVLSGIWGWVRRGQGQQQQELKQEQPDDDRRKPTAGVPNGGSTVKRESLNLGGGGVRASGADMKSELREDRGVVAEGDAGGGGASTGCELRDSVGSDPSRPPIDVTRCVDDGKVTDVLTDEGRGEASNGTDDRSTVDDCAGPRGDLARSSEATVGKVDKVDEVAESAGRGGSGRAGEHDSPVVTNGKRRRQGNARASQEHQLRRSDRFSGIAAWTLSSAEAFAGGAVFLLLAGMSRDTRQGEGERESSSGRSSRIVVEGGRPGSAREAKVVGQTA